MTAPYPEKETAEKYGNLPGPGPGRPRGLANKLTTEVREMVLAALEEAGGVDYLRRQADENPVAFIALLGKLLPRSGTLEVAPRLTLEELVTASYKTVP